jgi:uracil-DNA glycosylase
MSLSSFFVSKKRERENDAEDGGDVSEGRFLVPLLKDKEWLAALSGEFNKPYFLALEKFVQNEYNDAEKYIFPPRELIFNALNVTPLSNVKVVIYGQDPYHGLKQAMGLSFSVPDDVAIPSSLQNIFKEIKSQIPTWNKPKSGNLTKWAEKGVLLLNSCLTVEGGEAASHAKKGWETFTDRIMEVLSQRQQPTVFLLWGNFAIMKKVFVKNPIHLVLTSAHPSGLSASKGFYGNQHFKKTVE